MNRSLRTGALVSLSIVQLSLGCVPVFAQEDAVSRAAAEVSAALVQKSEPRFVPGEVIVKFKSVAAVGALPRAQLEPLGLQSSPRRTSGGELIYQISPSTARQLQSPQAMQQTIIDVTEKLAARADVEYAQPNWILQPVATVPNDAGYASQWHYFNNGTGPGQSPGGINLPDAWDDNVGDSSVVVAVLDTGYLPNHPDVTGSQNVGVGYDMISNTFVANDGDGRDSDPTDPGDAVAANDCFQGSAPRGDSWHGTHVAGTVGIGNTNNQTGVAGVNWNVTVSPVRVLGKCGGATSDINDAIRWAAGLLATPANPNPAKVINLSLGGPGACAQSPAMQSAINDAVSAGVTVVVAAGNDAQDAANFSPAGCDNVITVAASDYRGHLVTRYSNFGPTVEIMAPGGDVQRDDDSNQEVDGVLSTVNGGYAFYNGTSMASPHVAGVAALLLARNGSLTPAEVLSKLQDNAIPRSNNECPQPCGAGLLNANFSTGDPDVKGRYRHAPKLICGIQKGQHNMQFARGFYATTINVHNPTDEKVIIRKRLALAIPPGGQVPGEVFDISVDTLGPLQVLATDCTDIRKRVFAGTLPAPLIDGVVIIEALIPLEVTGVYTTATLNAHGTAEDHSSIHLERAPAYEFGKPE